MKPSLPQGTRDFNAATIRKRNYIINTIRQIFELYGFEPLETPAMENLETLMGKYGEEGDKLIYRILNSGNPFEKDFFESLKDFFKLRYEYVESLKAEESLKITINPYDIKIKDFDVDKIVHIAAYLNEKNNSKYLSNFKNQISEKALRYDLTIPFARYVAINHNKLTLPYKRYQIQPVWRADRPQKGRYREFYQCDADVVGSNSLLNEVEFANIYATVFKKLGIEVSVKINNRKILQGIAEYCGCIDKLTEITNAIDKLDKVGRDEITLELVAKGIPQEKIQNIFDCIFVNENELIYYTIEQLKDSGYTDLQIKSYWKVQNSKYKRDIGVLNCLEKWFNGDMNDINDSSIAIAPTGVKGVQELVLFFEYLIEAEININIEFDTTLARGLNYYTGCIFEVKAKDVKIGSIGGGGRDDNLTELFGVSDISGVGISFGVDRIYDAMEELKLFPVNVNLGTQVLFYNLGDVESKVAFILMQKLRDKDIRCEIYHENGKLDKQFKYAEKKGIRYIVIIGDKELTAGTCVVRDLASKAQQEISQEKLTGFDFNQ